MLPNVRQSAGSSPDLNERDTPVLMKMVRRGMVAVEFSSELVARLVFLL